MLDKLGPSERFENNVLKNINGKKYQKLFEVWVLYFK